MTRTFTTFAATAALLLAGAAYAQPSGGADAKGNAPLKRPHTIDDGAAKHGANSFTQNQARKHILNSGYSAVSGLAKGDDGVWRGMATKEGVTRQVALDFKGNVSEGLPAGAPLGPTGHAAGAASTGAAGSSRTAAAAAPNGGAESAQGASSSTTGAASASVGGAAASTTHHKATHHAKAGSRCANPTPKGAACSGVDKNGNGISDKEDRAISKGAKP